MAEKNNATCSICGKGYYKCMSCASDMKLSPWKRFCDTSSCYQIFQVVRGFNTGVYTKDEARSKLQNADLSNLDGFRDNIKKIIKDIMKDGRKAQIAEVSEPIVEEPIVEEPVVEQYVVEESVVANTAYVAAESDAVDEDIVLENELDNSFISRRKKYSK